MPEQAAGQRNREIVEAKPAALLQGCGHEGNEQQGGAGWCRLLMGEGQCAQADQGQEAGGCHAGGAGHRLVLPQQTPATATVSDASQLPVA